MHRHEELTSKSNSKFHYINKKTQLKLETKTKGSLQKLKPKKNDCNVDFEGLLKLQSKKWWHIQYKFLDFVQWKLIII